MSANFRWKGTVRWASITGALHLRNHDGSISTPVAVVLRRSSILNTPISIINERNNVKKIACNNLTGNLTYDYNKLAPDVF